MIPHFRPGFVRFLSAILPVLASFCLALPCQAGPDPLKAPGLEPTWKKLATGTGVNIRVTEKKRLKRIHTSIPDGPGYDWIEGVLVVEILNLSAEPITFEEFEAHNLAFVDIRSGRSYVLVHSCACVSQCEPEGQGANYARKAVLLTPGQTHTLTFDDFGCSGSMWVPPPEGIYDLYYRARPHTMARPPLKCPEKMDVKTTVDSCRSMLESDDFWNGAWTGQPVRLDLRKTHKRKP